jgi:pentose-5-phosphate-3-epimerase
VHLENIRAVRDAGATLLVSGSGVFWGSDPGAAYTTLVKTVTERAAVPTTTHGGR